MNSHRAGVVRHFHMEPPHTGPPGLHTFHGEHLTGHRGIAHFQIQRFHFHRLALNGIPHQHRAGWAAARRLFRRSLPLGGRLFLFQRQADLHIVQAIAPADGRIHLVQIRRLQRVPDSQSQLHGKALPLDAGTDHHGSQQLQPQLRGELQLCKQFKKRYLSRHTPFFPLSSAKAAYSFSISSIRASTSRSCGTL